MNHRFRIYSMKEISDFPSPRWRVKQLLPVGGFTMMYSSAGHGKTFMALDIALCVASGREFHGRPVQPGPALYVLGEGHGGLKNRVGAWMKEHNVKDVPDAFFVLEGVQFHRTQDVTDLKHQISRMSVKPQVVVIDTFARCAVGVEENDANSMGQWVDAVRRLQLELGVDVLVLHHAQKQQSKKDQQERGSSSFIGAVDTAVRLKRSGNTITVTCKKQKDAEEFDDFTLQMKTVDLGVSEFGEPMQSCVLTTSATSAGDLTANHRKLLAVLAELGGEASRGTWLQKAAVAERSFDRWREELQKLGFIEPTGSVGCYRLTGKHVDEQGPLVQLDQVNNAA